MQRRFIFLNHATPHDNAFTIWLGARLAAAGYEVWSDLLMLVGGEPFWKDIDEAIRQHTAVFVPILTPASVNLDREGVHNEIAIAVQAKRIEKLKDFIIPVQAERFRGGNPELQRLNYIPFADGWAEGLRRLLKKLQQLNVPRRTGPETEEMHRWLRVQSLLSGRVKPMEIELESNWLPIIQLPSSVQILETPAGREAWDRAVSSTRIPMRAHHRLAVTFAEGKVVSEEFGGEIPVQTAYELETDDFLFDKAEDGPRIKGIDARRMAVDMLRRGWEALAASSGLLPYEMSGRTAWYFPVGLLPGEWGHFADPSGKKRRRQMTGVRGSRKTRWHFALSAKPQILPIRRLVLNAHVVFSEANGTLVADPRLAIRYRKAVGRGWWNAEWRDRQRAAVAFLSKGMASFHLPLGGTEAVVGASALRFISPVSYETLQEQQEDISEDALEGEEDNFDELVAEEGTSFDDPEDEA